MPADGKEIVTRYERMKQERSNFDARWEEMAPFIAPSRTGITSRTSPGEKQSRNVYDSTTMLAAEMMAMFIAGHIINPSQQWFGLRMKDRRVGAEDSVMEWLEECRDTMLSDLSSSMFYAEGPESLIDYGGFGNGFLLIEEVPQPGNLTKRGFRGYHFLAEKIGRFVIADGADGLVDTAMREFCLTARVAADRWGIDRMPESIKNALARDQKPDKQFNFIHAVLPRKKAEQGAGALGMPWASVWIEKENRTVVHEGGYKVFPAAVPRYHRTPGEVYGRGRGDMAWPDTWTLNTAKRMALEDWALKIRPPVLTRHDSVIGTLRLKPGGYTTVNTHGMPIGQVIAPYQTGSHPEVSNLKEEELRRSIREIFYVDSIRMLLETSKSEMTAYEYARKMELLFRIMGPVYGRLEWEYLNRIVDICFQLKLDARAFPPPPPEIFEAESGEIEVEFQNPIAKAQRSGDAEALLMATNDLAPLGAINPEVWEHLDPDKTAMGIMEIRGVPARWRRSMDEILALRADKQQRQAAEAALSQGLALTEGVKNMAPMAKVMQDSQAEVVPAGVA